MTFKAIHALFCLVFLFSFAALLPFLQAEDGADDQYWQKRAEIAQEDALEAYHPNPEDITNDFNKNVIQQKFKSTNSTRRNLGRVSKPKKKSKFYKGPCRATNPIDRCWRCRPNWANNRKRLADCVLGFGHKTIGGKLGRYYVVTDASDSDLVNPKPGTLRHAVIQKGPLWIIFKRTMVITLSQELIVTSHKTIDGRGAEVHIAKGAGITIQFVKNVIIHGIKIHDIIEGNGGMIRDSVGHYGFRTRSDGDGISIFGSSNVWIDHVSMRNCMDGMIDVTVGSTAITISNSHFTHHNRTMLFGGSDLYTGDRVMQITVAFNHFGQGLVQRMPRCRYGFVHVVNNDYTHWQMYAIGGSSSPTIISQGNRFIAPPNNFAKEVTKRGYAPESVWKNWIWRSEGDLMMNGAFFVQSGLKVPFSRRGMIKAKPGTFVTRLTRFAGALNCKVNKAC